MRRCEACGRPLSALARPNRRHCNATCRQRSRRLRRGPGTIRPEVLAQMAEEAGALAEPALVAGLARAAAADWQASAFLLSRRYPERWGPPAVRAAGHRDLLDELEPEPS